MISSTTNPKVKYVRRLLSSRRFREQEQAFVIEGSRWLAELNRANVQPALILATEAWQQKAAGSDALPAGTAITLVTDQVLAHVSDTETPAGVVAVVPAARRPVPAGPTLLLILDAIANPGNLGTMLRTAAAAGVDAVLLGPGCVDAYNPKVVRGSMGAILRLPVASAGWEEIGRLSQGTQVWLAAAGGERAYDEVDWRPPSALIVGSEAGGAGRPANALAGGRIGIPMERATESLNAAIAAAVILFEAARQRRRSG